MNSYYVIEVFTKVPGEQIFIAGMDGRGDSIKITKQLRKAKQWAVGDLQNAEGVSKRLQGFGYCPRLRCVGAL